MLGFVAGEDFEEAIEESIHVVAVDSGTWPTDGGGVATCRELVLDYVQHVRWSVLSEIGNDFKQVRSTVITLLHYSVTKSIMQLDCCTAKSL